MAASDGLSGLYDDFVARWHQPSGFGTGLVLPSCGKQWAAIEQ